jgi:hypothetical protein
MNDPNAPATKADFELLRSSQEQIRSSQEQLRSSQEQFRSSLDELRSSTNELRSSTREEMELLRFSLDEHRAETSHQFDDLKETFRDSQTELLKAFYSYAEGTNKRMAERELNEVSMRSRIATLEERLLAVEKRLNMPPAA